MYTPMNLEENDIKNITLCFSISSQCFVKCRMCAHARYQRHVGKNVISIVSNN